MSFYWLIFNLVLVFFVFKIFGNHNRLKNRVSDLENKLATYLKGAKDSSPPDVSPESRKPPELEKPVKNPLSQKPIPVAIPELIKSETFKQRKNALKNLEESLSARWMVWVGGLAIALGGGFLVKYSIDAGLLSPLVRVSLGFIIGIILTIGGEILRQRRTNLKWLEGSPDYLPSAISAAGLFSAFAAIYASYALYDLLPALAAFIALALLSFVASGLAYYQGKFFAYLGLIGGIIVPALVTTGPPSAWGLFPFLLVIISASLWVSRQKAWVDVAATTLILALLWVFIWIPTNWALGDIIPVGFYLLLLGGLNSALLSGASPERPSDKTLKGMISGNSITFISDLVMLTIVILITSIVRLDHYSMVGFIIITTGLVAQAYAIHRSPANDTGGVIALFGTLFLFATWHIPSLMEFKAGLLPFDRMDTAWAPTSPPELEKFLIAVLVFSSATGITIFMRLRSLMRKNVWASVGCIVPILMLIITYWRIEDWGTSLIFAFVALILACLFVVCVNKLSAENKQENLIPIAAYAAGATTAISLGIAMALRDAWLSFAFALQIAALAHIWRITMVRGLRTLALILASIVFIRLTFNGSIFDYGGGGSLPVFNWLFYGYALTAALFAYSAHIFKQDGKEDRLMSVLKAGAILLSALFVTFELRVLFSKNNSLLSDTTVLETALQTINWSVATTALFWYEVKNNDTLLGRLRRFMTVISLLGIIVGGGMLNNVFFDLVDVGSTPIFNMQFLQFFIPGLLYGLKAYIAQIAGKSRSLKLYGTVAFLILWFWVTAEVYNSFHPNEFAATTSNWEWYAYSLVWLIYAVVLLLAGLKLQQPTIRKAGLAVLGIVVLKVFLVDMNQLEGLARALSFMGLGGALIGLGYLYQKLNLNQEIKTPS